MKPEEWHEIQKLMQLARCRAKDMWQKTFVADMESLLKDIDSEVLEFSERQLSKLRQIVEQRRGRLEL